MIGRAHQLVVPWMFPAGAVVAIVAHENVQECVGIIVIADPTAPAQIVVQRGLRREINLPFELAQFDFDPQFPLPHALQLNADLLVQFPAVEQVLEGGEVFAAGA